MAFEEIIIEMKGITDFTEFYLGPNGLETFLIFQTKNKIIWINLDIALYYNPLREKLKSIFQISSTL